MDKDPNALSAVEKARLLKQQKEEEKKAEEQKQLELEEQQKQSVQKELQDIDSELQKLRQEKAELESRLASVRGERLENISGQRQAVKELKSSEETEDILNEEGVKEEIFGADDEALEGLKTQEGEVGQQIQELEEKIAGLQEKRTEVYHKTPEGLAELEKQQQEQEHQAKYELFSEITQEVERIGAPQNMTERRYVFYNRDIDGFDALREKFGDDALREYYTASDVTKIQEKYKNKEEEYENIEDFFTNHSNEALYNEVEAKFQEFQDINSVFFDFIYKHENDGFISKFRNFTKENQDQVSNLWRRSNDKSSMRLDSMSSMLDQRINAVKFRKDSLEKIINGEVDGEEKTYLKDMLSDTATDNSFYAMQFAEEIFNTSKQGVVLQEHLYDKKISQQLQEKGIRNFSASNAQNILEELSRKKEEEVSGPKNSELELVNLNYELNINHMNASRLSEEMGIRYIYDKKKNTERLSVQADRALQNINEIRVQLSENFNKPIVWNGQFTYEGAVETAQHEIDQRDNKINQNKVLIEELNQKLQKKKSLFQSADAYQKELNGYKEDKTNLQNEIESLQNEKQKFQRSEYLYPHLSSFFVSLNGSEYGVDSVEKEFVGKFGDRFETLDDMLKKMEEFAKEKQGGGLSEEEQKILQNEENIQAKIDELNK